MHRPLYRVQEQGRDADRDQVDGCDARLGRWLVLGGHVIYMMHVCTGFTVHSEGHTKNSDKIATICSRFPAN